MPHNIPGWVFWVFTTVVLSLILNVAAAYLKSPIDQWLNRRSDRRRIKSQKYQKEIDTEVLWMLHDPGMVTHHATIRITFLSTSILMPMLSMIILVFLVTPTLQTHIYIVLGGGVLVIFTTFISLVVLKMAHDERILLEEYRRQSSERFEAHQVDPVLTDSEIPINDEADILNEESVAATTPIS